MFRMECFCDDKNLAKVHHALSGLVLELKTMPVPNAKHGKNGTVASKTNGNVIELLAQWCKENKKTTVHASDIKEFARTHGRSVNSYSSIVTKAQKAGLLKKVGKGTKTGYAVQGKLK